MREVRTFVQFIHPGLEHGSDRGSDVRSWNDGMHRRKFMKVRGRVLSEGRGSDSDLLLWGEWEPASRIIARFPLSTVGHPRYLHEPLAPTVPDVVNGLQNTDPFIFGENFLYTCCQQFTKVGPTQLRYMSSGSVIAFGSHLRGRFVLDTLFVVQRSLDHAPTNDPGIVEAVTSDTYRLATVERIYASDAGRPIDYRLYFGATPKDPAQGMFSFFPCKPFHDGEAFARPKIVIDEFVNPALKQGYKIHKRELSVEELRRLWETIREQVEDQGLWLGVHAALPVDGEKPPS